MKKVIKSLTVAAAATMLLALPSSSYAACPFSQALFHGLDGFFQNCPDATPVAGYFYALGQDATLNSGSADGICEDGSVQTSQLVPCQPGAGVAGDGIVTVQYDWGGTNGTPAGCPNSTQAPNVGRNVIQVVANNGASVLLSVGFEANSQTYLVEGAQPYDAGSGSILPLSCSTDMGMTLQSNTGGLAANTVCVNQIAPPFFSDCDAGSVGEQFGTCATETKPTIAPGQLYTRSGACNSLPDARKTAWTLLTSTAGPNGSKCVQVTVPPTPVGQAPQCAFVGGTSLVGGVETSAMTGSIRITSAAAASDKVAIKKATLGQGKLSVDFGTENEATIVGFNVYGGSTKLNSGLIAAKGVGSNDYSFEVGRGALKNERAITVEAVKSDGTSVRSASVSVK